MENNQVKYIVCTDWTDGVVSYGGEHTIVRLLYQEGYSKVYKEILTLKCKTDRELHSSGQEYTLRGDNFTIYYMIQMRSLVFGYINEKGEECVTIGNYQYYKTLKDTVQQIAWMFHLEHDGERWYNFTELGLQERIAVLMQLKDKTLFCYNMN